MLLISMNKDNVRQDKLNTAGGSEFVVTKDTNLGELVFRYPDTAEVLLDYGLHCVGCFASTFDTIEAGCRIHGMSNEEIEEIVERLNEVINFKE